MYYAYYPSVRALIEELTIGLERQVAVGLTSTKVNNQVRRSSLHPSDSLVQQFVTRRGYQ